MTFLPIVDRELRITARRPATYRNRALAAAAVTIVAMVMIVFGAPAAAPSQIGAYIFRTLSFLAYLFCLLEGVRKTADCLSEERRAGTLGLLFLTDLKGYDVVLGKLAATSLSSFYGLIGILPVLALPLLLGGITAGEFWRTALALANLLFFSLATGIWVPSRCREERRALAGTLLVIILLLFVPTLTKIHLLAFLNPGYAVHCAKDVLYAISARRYWLSLLVTQLISWLMLASASVAVTRIDEEKLPKAAHYSQSLARPNESGPDRAASRARLLDVNPFLWLACRNVGPRIFLWSLAGGIFGLMAILLMSFAVSHEIAEVLFSAFIFSALFVNFLVKIRLASQASHCFAEARQNNALEILLSTPLTVEEITDGQFLALKRIFLVPVVVILFCELAGGGAATIAAGWENNSVTSVPLPFLSPMLPFAGFASACFALSALDLLAVTWAGMWFGLSSKNESQAIFKTIFYVLLLPFALVLVPCLGWLFVLLWPIFWIAWSRPRVLSQFRNIAERRFSANQGTSTWWPFANEITWEPQAAGAATNPP